MYAALLMMKRAFPALPCANTGAGDNCPHFVFKDHHLTESDANHALLIVGFALAFIFGASRVI